MEFAEFKIDQLLAWLILGIKIIGAGVVALGVGAMVVHLVNNRQIARESRYQGARLTLGRFLILALELELAADILETTVTPTWVQIGKLASIAVIRTFLNYFLERELQTIEQAA